MTRVLARAWWYVRAVMGETAYDTYLEHRGRTHPGEPVLTRREFEERRTKPNVRCC
ncbi:YbdD/YjiX family protein [Virgisporangium ochraceum]|uniref:YbdD/YjiX family protein n=1 Tax=Virgisporangium ochraceum TaxID=65505 RepID=A0A8J4A4W7_9ACTN|nr:YbdD/YjiX family protein [Virgisporangium ochraceum]GIJ73905.1 hypothetical protein Voc01_088220 [Virgisporangium ochraceum]